MRKLIPLLLFVLAPAHAQDPQSLLERGLNPCNAQYVAEAVRLGANPNFKIQARPALSRCLKSPAIVMLLLGAGADVEAVQEEFGTTPLMDAARSGPTRTVEFLLDAGARVNRTSKSGVTALMYAAENRKGYNSLLLLLKAGADPNAADKFGKTALMQAAHNGNVANMQALITAGARIDAVSRGRSALWMASETRRYSAMEFLVNAGADIDLSTPITLLNPTNPNGVYTPIMSAIARDDEKGVELLLSLGASTSVRDINGKTPLQIARARGKHGLARLLEAE